MTLQAKHSTNHTYRQILGSTALIGGSALVTLSVGMIRSKVIAVLLGPTGVGLISIYTSIVELAETISSLGITNSGVRQIAEANGSGEPTRVAQTAAVLRYVSVFLALLGALLLVVLAGPISRFSFQTDQHTFGVALLAVAVFFRILAAGQTALIQGMRRIPDLARLSIFSALISTAIGIPLIFKLREQGIVPVIVATAAVSALVAWYYRRKIPVLTSAITLQHVALEASSMLQLGVAFMMSGLLTIGAAYGIRLIVLQHGGIEAAGLYQAAWTLGGLYTGFILQAMGTDFYPRLTASANNNQECNRLVNEQAHISILLAGPGIIATITLAPLVLTLFYSGEFHAAAGAVRWFCFGMMLRVIAWPMGFIVLAKGARRIFLWTEIAAALVHVSLAWYLFSKFGLGGAGAAFFLLYVWHSSIIYLVVRRLSGFRWSTENLKLGALFVLGVAAVLCGFFFFSFWMATTIGLVAATLSGFHSVRVLLTLYSTAFLPTSIRPWFTRSA